MQISSRATRNSSSALSIMRKHNDAPRVVVGERGAELINVSFYISPDQPASISEAGRSGA